MDTSGIKRTILPSKTTTTESKVSRRGAEHGPLGPAADAGLIPLARLLGRSAAREFITAQAAAAPKVSSQSPKLTKDDCENAQET